ncbi:MAG TPA: hypothetical protein QGF58_23515 [Myxococcota bacterium]|nr:hypothetical protein [Myxococcota bacterium]
MLLWTLAACAGRAPGSAPDEPPPEVTEAPAPPPPEATAAEPVSHPVVATWTSGPCGDRGYPRELTFTPDFRYVGRDLVAPCPPDVTCIWDGVIEFGGSWSDDGPMLTLVEEELSDDGEGAPRPGQLRRTQSGHLTETIGDETCGYERAD